MADIVYAKDTALLSRTQIQNPDSYEGEYSILGTYITLQPGASVTYIITFSSILNSKKLKRLLFMGGVEALGLVTPYNTDATALVKVRVKYYKLTTEAGAGETRTPTGETLATLYPFEIMESVPYTSEVAYDPADNAIDIELQSDYIESIEVTFRNLSDLQVVFEDPNLYEGETVGDAINSGVERVAQSIDFSVVLNQLIAYSDGCELYFDKIQMPDRLYYLADENNNFAGVKVVPGNGGPDRIIKFSRKNEALPALND